MGQWTVSMTARKCVSGPLHGSRDQSNHSVIF